MKQKTNTDTCDLMIIGAGMAGTAAALFAAQRGLATVQAGRTGETLYASGLLDLYGVSHSRQRESIDDPWQGLRRLGKAHPEHPYSRIPVHQIRRAMDDLTRFLGQMGLGYRGRPDTNVRVITPVGTIKTTYRVPATMWAGVAALASKAPCLIVDVIGLRGFSARQIQGTLKPNWPALKAATIHLPWEAQQGPKYAEQIAWRLQVPSARRQLADVIRPHLGAAEFVGLPAILGIHDADACHEDLERMIGRPVFEIPTMPPAIAGIRLKETFAARMPEMGVRTHYHHTVHHIRRQSDGRFHLGLGRNRPETIVLADRVLLATGRFLGKGLVALRQGIRESLLDLPVHQPENRSCWHRNDFLDAKGHAINLAGIMVDDRFRPVTATGTPVYDNLYAAGSILAHQDWMRTKSGTGLAAATAFAAVHAMCHPEQDTAT